MSLNDGTTTVCWLFSRYEWTTLRKLSIHDVGTVIRYSCHGPATPNGYLEPLSRLVRRLPEPVGATIFPACQI